MKMINRCPFLCVGGSVFSPINYLSGSVKTFDYCGRAIYENKVFFDGGYFKATSLNTAPSTTYGFTLYYHNKDHLGNIREVVNVGGTVQQVTNYYPCGAPYADPAAVSGADFQPYKYNFSVKREERKHVFSSEREKNRPKVNGKELDKMHGLNTYDYGARQYNPVTARWDRVDPMAEKYYSVSPYVYGRNNPVMFVDPDGRKIVLAGGVSNSFKQDYALTVQTFEENGCNDVWKLLNESLEVYTIVEGNGDGNYFDPSTKTISWNSRKGLYTNNDVYLSPATRLNHELSHALQFDTNPKQYDKDNTTVIDEDDNTYTIEEKRVIEGIETQTAMCLGEINSGEITRYDHSGTTFVTNSPISNKDLNHIEIIIYPQNKQ